MGPSLLHISDVLPVTRSARFAKDYPKDPANLIRPNSPLDDLSNRNMFQNHAFPEISFIFPNESSKENSSFPEFYLGKTGHSAHCCTKIAVANEPSVNQKNRQKITTIRRLQTIAFLVLMVQEGRWSVYDSPNHSLRSLPTATKYIKCQLAQARQRDKIQ